MRTSARYKGDGNRWQSSAAAAHAPLQIRGRWVDCLAGFDPGLNRFRLALHIAATIAAILGAEALFVHFWHVMQIQSHAAKLPAAQAAAVAAANHRSLVVAMLVGVLIGLLSTFGVMDKTARSQFITILFLPVPLVGTLALELALSNHRVVALICLSVITAIATYVRRFGPRGFVGGVALFVGIYLGFTAGGAITLRDLGWVAAEMGVGLVVALAIRFILFYPRQAKALERIRRSYDARARKVAALALELLDNPAHTGRDVHRLHHQLTRLNEAALMIDAQLGAPDAVADGSFAHLLHRQLFDAELALTDIARAAETIARVGLPASQRFEARLALREVAWGNNERARAHAVRLIALLGEAGSVSPGQDHAVTAPYRFAGSIIALADALSEWMADGATDVGKGVFRPAVQTPGGWLPGSAQVSSIASLEPGPRRSERVRLPLYSRTAIQMGIASGAAIALGDLASGRYFYWAVIPVFITFMGTFNSSEHAQKAFLRLVGVAVGVVVGSLLATLVGHHTNWSIAVILVAFFLAYYLIRINYAFCAMGITVVVAQLYTQLGVFSASLMLRRLEETAIGAAIAIVVVMLVFPLRTRRVLRVAVRTHVQAIGRLVAHASQHLLNEDHDTDSTLRSGARAVDAAYHALTASAHPLRRIHSGTLDRHTSQGLRLAAACHNHSRNLVADSTMAGPLDADSRVPIQLANANLRRSLDAIVRALSGERDGVYIRSTALFDQASRRIEERSGLADPAYLAVRDLELIDGTLARMADFLGLAITDSDTGSRPASVSRPA
jgi:uncharacterized membrane protein YgaE (UPF0421/DUF939 family)